MAERATIEILRYRPEREPEPVWERFDVPYQDNWMVLDALNHIKDRLDGSLSYRWACRMGVCGSCGMMVNGEPTLTCATYLESVLPGAVRIEPLRGFPVIRDLVGDLDGFIDKLQRVKPWLIRQEDDGPPDGEEFRQTPEELSDYKQYSMCINCMLCYAACPIVELEPGFLGPAAIALAQRYNLDSRDQGSQERMEILATHDGLWGCTFVGECSAVCPKDVDPAGAIQRYKVAATIDWFRSLLPWPGR
jgi:fumarate reductase iron-sulfur subunit